MTRTPDETKKGLECCSKGLTWDETCGTGCPYEGMGYGECSTALSADAIALIQQLEAQVPKWISVEERLPEKHHVVLVYLRFGMIDTGVHNGFKWWNDLGIANNENVTHWMPLPSTEGLHDN